MEKITIFRVCPQCRKDSAVDVLITEFNSYQDGALVQDAFPSLNADEREVVKTGIHPACWDEMLLWLEDAE
jgi:hypothetical protein